MRIAFHGANAASFSEGFASMVGGGAEVAVLSDGLASAAEREAFSGADVLIGNRFDASLPRPERLRLFHLPAAGYDAVNFALLPRGTLVCNCFGHEQAIAEYVMAALLQRAIPLADADRRMREGDWAYWAGAPERVHEEIGGSTIGLLGFGHIGKAVAARARAFGMRVHVANRSAVAESAEVDRYFPLANLPEFWGSADYLVVTVPLTEETRGMVGRAAFTAMRPRAVLVNVARGPVVDEAALYNALAQGRIGGAVIDTWYRYPRAGSTSGTPSALDFAALPNLLMTPHMSGWTRGTIRRRQETMAENVRRMMQGERCENVVRET
jgi:phosphoglycerate dehydrogenase-like enzyme